MSTSLFQRRAQSQHTISSSYSRPPAIGTKNKDNNGNHDGRDPTSPDPQDWSKRFMKGTVASESRTHPRIHNTSSSGSGSSSHSNHKARPEETLEKTKHNILRFTRSSDRRMLLRTLNHCSYLKHIPIQTQQQELQFPSSMTECQQLEAHLARNLPVSFNGLLLGNVEGNNDNNIKSPPSTMHMERQGKNLLLHLRILCNKIAASLPKSDTQITSDELYYDILMRLAPSRGTSISFQRLHLVAGGSKDLVVQRPQTPVQPLEPVQLDLYVNEHQQVHAMIRQQHAYGLYRKSDAVNGKPWVGLTARIHERVNLTTGAAVRELHFDVHEERFLM